MSNKIKTKLVLAVHSCMLRKSETTTPFRFFYTRSTKQVNNPSLKDGHRLLLDRQEVTNLAKRTFNRCH